MKSRLFGSAIFILSWVFVTAATPLVNFDVDDLTSDTYPLQARQEPACKDTYSSKNGLNFTSYCNQNNPASDATDPFEAKTMDVCIEHCSRYWGDGEGCFGVTWRAKDMMCWLRNSSTSTTGFSPDAGLHSALIEEGAMNGTDTKCPQTNGSTNALPQVDGVSYTTHCGQSIMGFDNCFDGYNECLSSPYFGYYHATSLEQCLRICVNEHPLCKAVTFNPGMEIGFANCWLKTGLNDTALKTPAKKNGIMHSAVLSWPDDVNNTCPTQAYTASTNGTAYDIRCGQVGLAGNLTQVHKKSMTDCMEECAQRPKCMSASFEPNLQDGYKNCYLHTEVGQVEDREGFMHALPKGMDPVDPGDSNTWIAGPVIGSVAAVAILAFGIFWWRRRKRAKAASAYAPKHGEELDGREKGVHEISADGQIPSELPSSIKYAQISSANTAPVELPGHIPGAELPTTVAPASPQELPASRI